MTDTTGEGLRPPRTPTGRRVFRSLDLPDATSAVVTVADILAIETEAVGLMYGSDQEAGYAAVAEAEAAASDAGLLDRMRVAFESRFDDQWPEWMQTAWNESVDEVNHG